MDALTSWLPLVFLIAGAGCGYVMGHSSGRKLEQRTRTYGR